MKTNVSVYGTSQLLSLEPNDIWPLCAWFGRHLTNTRGAQLAQSLLNPNFLTSLSPSFDQKRSKRPHHHLLRCETGYMVYCLDITYVLCYLARVMSDATEGHTTRSWSIRLSDSSASCTQFWMTVPIPPPGDI